MATLTINPPWLFGAEIRLGLDCVVMILGVGRIDGDERHVPPILSALQGRGLRLLRFLLRLAAENGRDAVRVDRDQTDRALGSKRTEALDHAGGRQSQARCTGSLYRDQIAVLCVGCSAGRDREFLAQHLLVDRLQASSALRVAAKYPEHAVLGMIDDSDDAAAVTNAVFFLSLLNTQENTVADAGGFTRPHLARHLYPDFRGGPVCVFIPFVRSGDEVAVAVARRHIGEHGRGQDARIMQLLAPLLDGAFVGELAQHALEVGAQGVFQAKGAGDFARADFARLGTDKGEDVGLGGKGGCFLGWGFQNKSPAPRA